MSPFITDFLSVPLKMSFLLDALPANQFNISENVVIIFLLAFVILPLMIIIVIQFIKFKNAVLNMNSTYKVELNTKNKSFLIQNLSLEIIDGLFQPRDKKCKTCNNSCSKSILLIAFLLVGFQTHLWAQSATADGSHLSLFKQSGIIITLVLSLVPLLLGIIIALVKINHYLKNKEALKKLKISEALIQNIKLNDDPEFIISLKERSEQIKYSLEHNELAGNEVPNDKKGLVVSANQEETIQFLAPKKSAVKRPNLDADITKLILWYIGFSLFWLIVGTGIGEYIGIKFISPDIDHSRWLSFGKLRPIHTNIVFWGWASLGMMAMGYYVIPTVSNCKIYSVKIGWWSLILTNITIVIGCLCLLNGMNNGGGEFREFIWPVIAFFAVALIITLFNFLMTVANRKTKEIYISNWYIISSFIFTIVVALTAYIPLWQDGVSETIVQGYFMHSGVGMWFTLQILGLMYYFIPMQLNQPIYSYSLGILAFWTQILFYTIIGTHHFNFAPIPWWLQMVGIVGSVGMIIPVLAATINFLLTFKGNGHKIATSYSLPFFLVAVIFYGVVSLQGTAEAFQFTNLLWHFTDFTVGHAHLGFYGIITFALWGCTYAIVPRLTGKEPSFSFVGVHFWLAFIGLILYGIPLSIGSTIKGIMWMEGRPFIDSVIVMFDYWVWRAIGGSLMFISHLIFAYNFYMMVKPKDLAIEESNPLIQIAQ